MVQKGVLTLTQKKKITILTADYPRDIQPYRFEPECSSSDENKEHFKERNREEAEDGSKRMQDLFWLLSIKKNYVLFCVLISHKPAISSWLNGNDFSLYFPNHTQAACNTIHQCTFQYKMIDTKSRQKEERRLYPPSRNLEALLYFNIPVNVQNTLNQVIRQTSIILAM